MSKKLTQGQRDFCASAGNYENGKVIDLYTSMNLPLATINQMAFYARGATVSSMAQTGAIEILDTYWRGVKVKIIDTDKLSRMYETGVKELPGNSA